MECKICNHAGSVIRDYEGFYVATASNPVSDGHVTIICKEHKPFAALNSDEFRMVAKIVKSTFTALTMVFRPDATKLIIENGEMQNLGFFELYIIEGVPFEMDNLDECSGHMHIEIIPCYSDLSKFNAGRKPFGAEKDKDIAAEIKRVMDVE